MNNFRILRHCVSFMVLAAATCCLACGGGGGGGGSGGGVVEVCQFTPDGEATPGTVVALDGSSSTCTSLEIDLVATDLLDVFSVSFEATFDPAVVKFERVSTMGSVLESGGTTLTLLVAEVAPGRVAIGVTRFDNTGVDVGGIAVPQENRVLLTLVFSKNALGSTTLVFTETKILGSETPPVLKSEIDWTGGVIEAM